MRSVATETERPGSAAGQNGQTSRDAARPVSQGEAGPLPIVFGITGHRDLRPEDLPALEKRVEAIFAEFRARYPHTPLTLLSPLAEGADRLAARVALRQGVRLVVPLPMPREEYVKDFESGSSRAQFDELARQADRVFELPLLTGNTADAIANPGPPRAEQYALAGAYIAYHCQLLIALWSGIPCGEIGGTADVVGYKREGIPERCREALSPSGGTPRAYLDPPENGPVYHIVTPRAKHPGIMGEPFSLHKHFPREDEEDAEAEATFARIYENIDAFNENALLVARDPALTALRKTNEGYLLSEAETATLPDSLRTLRDRYAIADTLAQHFQRLTFQTLKRLCILVFVAVLSFELSAKLVPDNGWLALVFPALLAATYGLWYSTVRKGKWQDRYQDYRALAEGMRVEFFWRLAGLPTSVADHYLRKQRGELDWIRIAIRNMGEAALAPTLPLDAPEQARRFGLVREHWVQNQARYFHRAAHRDDRELERYEAWVKALMIASPVVAVLTALSLLFPPALAHWMHSKETGGYLTHKLLIILVFVLAGVAGVLHTYVDKRALSQHAKQYERMGTLFAAAEHRIKEFLGREKPAEARQVVFELGREALAENGDWVMTHRERPVDVPHAG